MSRAQKLTKLQADLARRICLAIEAMTGMSISCQPLPDLQPGEFEQSSPDLIGWSATFNVGDDASVFLFASRATVHALGKMVLEAAGVEEFDAPTLESTYTEVISQAASSWAQDLSDLSQRKWEVSSSGNAAALSGNALSWGYDVQAEGVAGQLLVQVSPSLVAALEEQPTAPPAQPQPQFVSEPAPPPTHYDLLLDVELPVSVSFGRALVPLKEVLKLSSGSIVELNRAVSEPVEVIVNNCVIARGEVVVVEGNYGVRIQQIVSRQDRLRSVN
jgi:flagellar motor switch protein FliN/FliY